MDTYTSFAIIALAALIHASFQLSVSMLTLLGGHGLSRNVSRRRLLHLSSSFVVGTLVITTLLLSMASYVSGIFARHGVSPFAWSIVSGLMMGLGVAVWLFYYRPGRGTALWIPRGMSRFLSDRTKTTTSGTEAFSLGLVSGISELVFIAASLVGAAFAIITLPSSFQLLGVALYVLISIAPLVTVYSLISSGTQISRIQRWRESNKQFLQYAAGSGLLILGFFTFVNEAIAASVILRGGL